MIKNFSFIKKIKHVFKCLTCINPKIITAMLIARPITVIVKKSIILAVSNFSCKIFVKPIPLHKNCLLSSQTFALNRWVFLWYFSSVSCLLFLIFSLNLLGQVSLCNVVHFVIQGFFVNLGDLGFLKRFSFSFFSFLVSFFAFYFWWIKLYDLSRKKL